MLSESAIRSCTHASIAHSSQLVRVPVGKTLGKTRLYRDAHDVLLFSAVLILVAGGCAHTHLRTSNTILVVTCHDAETLAPLSAWGYVTDSDGERLAANEDPQLFVVPAGAFLFSTSYRMTVPLAVPLTVHVEKGFDYAIGSVTVRPDRSETTVSVPLRRISEPNDHGWYCAPAHLHMQVSRLNPKYSHESIIDMMTWWPSAAGYDVLINHAMGVGEKSLPQEIWGWNADYFPAGRWFPPSPTDTLYDMGEEYRANPEGHVLFWNLKSYVQPGSAGDESYLEGRPSIPTIVDAGTEALAQDAYFAFAHAGGGNSLEIAVCLGLCSAINMGDLGFGYDRWYRLLNAGFRVAAVAGPDFVFPNGARFYAKIDSKFCWETWMDAVRSGRTFATSGPLVYATVQGLDPGSELRMPTQGSVRVQAEVVSKRTFEAVEIVANGKVVKRIPIKGVKALIDETIDVRESSWIAVRVVGHPDDEMIWETADEPPIRPDFMRQAHTTPVYCIVNGQAVGSVAALRKIAEWNSSFYLRWIEEQARFDDPVDRARSLQHYVRAQSVIASMIQQQQSTGEE